MLWVYLVLLVSFLLFASYYFVESMKFGLKARSWFLVGCAIGPMALPMFHISKHMALRKSCGFNRVYFIA